MTAVKKFEAKILRTRRSQHSQECHDPCRQCFAAGMVNVSWHQHRPRV